MPYVECTVDVKSCTEKNINGYPTWIFADEATSALDAQAEDTLYKRLIALVKSTGGAIVSIAHRPSVGAFHDQRWTLERQPEGSTSLYQITQSKVG